LIKSDIKPALNWAGFISRSKILFISLLKKKRGRHPTRGWQPDSYGTAVWVDRAYWM